MLMLMMMVMTVHNFTPWWMLTPAAINFTPHAGKTADVSLSPPSPPPVIDFTTIALPCIELLLVLSTNRLNPHSYQHQCDWILQVGPTGGFHSPGQSIKSKIRIANHFSASHLIIINNTLLSLLWSKPVSCLQNTYFWGTHICHFEVKAFCQSTWMHLLNVLKRLEKCKESQRFLREGILTKSK